MLKKMFAIATMIQNSRRHIASVLILRNTTSL